MLAYKIYGRSRGTFKRIAYLIISRITRGTVLNRRRYPTNLTAQSAGRGTICVHAQCVSKGVSGRLLVTTLDGFGTCIACTPYE